MTRTSKIHTLRVIPQLFGVLVLFSLAALAQTGGLGTSGTDPENPLFLAVVTYLPGGFDALSVAVADVNGDGKPDVIASNLCFDRNNCTEGSVGVLLGNGDGTFQPAVEYDSGGGQGYSVAVADVNGDGMPDLVVANCGPTGANCNSGPGMIGVLLGNGDGTFQAAETYSSGGTFALSVAVADVNRDGKLDLLVANDCGIPDCGVQGSIGVLLGNGDGTFQGVTTISSSDTVFLTVADVNSDNKPDLLATIFNGVEVLLGKGDGTFNPAVKYDSDVSTPHSIAVGDVNGDGKLDMLTTRSSASNSCADGSVDVLLGNGDGTFQSAASICLNGLLAKFVAVGDVNGDGKPDLTVAESCVGGTCSNGSSDGLVGALPGNGTGTFQQVAAYDSGGTSLRSLALADLNGDGRPDLVAVGGGVGVLLNNTGPHTSTATTLVSNVNPAAPKQRVTYTATVTGQPGVAVTGKVVFRDGSSEVATVTLAGNQAVFSTKYNVNGAHPITAMYSGDLHNTGSVSATLTEYIGRVFPAPTVTVLTTSGSPSFVGQSVTIIAAVSPTNSKYGTIPDGELVTFFDGTIAIGTGTTTSGAATFVTSSLTAKTHTIKGTYAGDTIFKPSSGTVKQVVDRYSTTTTLTSSPNPSQFGQAVTFTAHVTSTGPAPTGKVKFLDGTTGIGSATLSGGVAKLTKSTLAVGTHPITAQYVGDAASNKSTSPVVNQVVQ